MELGFEYNIGCAFNCKYKWPVGTKKEDLLFCSGCNEIVYCSDTCAKKDWPKHMSACKGVKKISMTIYPSQESIENGKIIKAEMDKSRQTRINKQINESN